MNIVRARFCLMMLCFSLPFGWCWGQVLHSSQDPSHSVKWGVGEGLHSSTNPNGWVGALPVSPEGYGDLLFSQDTWEDDGKWYTI